MSMEPKQSWKMHLYGASADAGAGTPYEKVLLSTISGYTGYVTPVTTYISQSGSKWEVESFFSADVSGSIFGTSRRRKVFDVVCWPFAFEAGATQELDDIDTLTALIDTKTYLWVRFEAGSRAQPSATEAYPVIIESYSHDVNAGHHSVRLAIKHRYRY